MAAAAGGGADVGPGPDPASLNASDVAAIHAAVAKQGGWIRALKADGKGKSEIVPEVAKLKALKAMLTAAMAEQGGAEAWEVDQKMLDDVVLQRMFVVPGFEIYGSVGGLFDFGPPGAALKDNFLAEWRRHFILEENMLQLETTTLTPDAVLRTSGHVERFNDLMVRDESNGECYRADKLLEDCIEELLKGPELAPERRDELRRIHAQADAFSPEELHGHLQALGVKSPSSGSPLTEPFPFNLMFTTSIGPAGNQVGYLRPETAQGIFVNFRRLLDYNGGRIPFAAAQIGAAYRNEIAPRGGLLRVREFTMAEIEHFVHPDHKSHEKFETVADVELTLYTAHDQVTTGETKKMTIGAAVETGLVDNQTLGYFMARTQLLLTNMGINPRGLRFRQHLRTEMAHYACDCWDAEILMSAGWVECVGHADRSAYDLTVHAKKTKVGLVASERLPEPVTVEYAALKANRGLMGRTFKKANKAVVEALAELEAEDQVEAAMALHERLQADGEAAFELPDGQSVTLTKDMVQFKRASKKVSERKYTPNVIEPSFGVGRILTGILEHTFYKRADGKRTVFRFPPRLAPTTVAVFPLDGRVDPALVLQLDSAFKRAGIAVLVDRSGVSIGRRYSRVDEIGVPFAITVEQGSQASGVVTLRHRDSMAQVEVSVAEVVFVVRDLVEGSLEWDSLMQTHKVISAGEGQEASPAAAAAAPAAAAGDVTGTAQPKEALELEGGSRPYGRFARPVRFAQRDRDAAAAAAAAAAGAKAE